MTAAALAQEEVRIDLGDLVAGGDGTGTADPEVIGIHPDSGLLEFFHLDGPIPVSDGASLELVGDDTSPFIDSVFIIDIEEMPINSAGVTFSFPSEDVIGQTWNHILKDRIGGENTPISVAGVPFERGVGIHAAAGITFDLEEIRDAHGEDAVVRVSAFAGMGDTCLDDPGSVTTYLILSDEEEVLESVSHRASQGGELLELAIPPEALFLTLASGAGNGRFYCNAGTFADAAISSVACPGEGDTHCTALTVEPLEGGAAGSYLATATAADDSGDEILYTFQATDGVTTLTRGPQPEVSAVFEFEGGVWTVSVSVDDDPACADAAADRSCDPVAVSTCPAERDTVCSGLVVEPAGGAPGLYRVSATARDASGDDILYTFTAELDGGASVVQGPQAEDVAVFYLSAGTWNVRAVADDDPGCPDEAAGAVCPAVEVAVSGEPEGIDLGDIVGGGDGTGTAEPEVVGIHPDSGLLEFFHLDGTIQIGDGEALQEVDDETSPYVDSVFIIDVEEMPINTAGVTFSFPPEDVLGVTWNHILAHRIGGENTPISLGGLPFEHGVGIHAAAGVTFDLEEIRADHGLEAVGRVSAFAGMGDTCLNDPGSVTTYLILSDEDEVIDYVSHRSSRGGRLLELSIPPEGLYLTLASGAGDGRFYCNGGTFAEARISADPGAAGVGPFLRGDCNGDGSVRGEVTDAVFLLQFNFAGAAQPACLAACDANGDGTATGQVTDAVYLLTYNFAGGAPPVAPFPACGRSSAASDAALGCETAPAGCP